MMGCAGEPKLIDQGKHRKLAGNCRGGGPFYLTEEPVGKVALPSLLRNGQRMICWQLVTIVCRWGD